MCPPEPDNPPEVSARPPDLWAVYFSRLVQVIAIACAVLSGLLYRDPPLVAIFVGMYLTGTGTHVLSEQAIRRSLDR